MRFVVQYLDVIVAMATGLAATHVAWCRAETATPGLAALGHPERWIGPMLILFAVLKLAVAP